VKAGDLVRLRKSHPAVQRWRKSYRRLGHPFIGKWADAAVPLLVLEECDHSIDRWRVIGPGGALASFDGFLLIRYGARNESR